MHRTHILKPICAASTWHRPYTIYRSRFARTNIGLYLTIRSSPLAIYRPPPNGTDGNWYECWFCVFESVLGRGSAPLRHEIRSSCVRVYVFVCMCIKVVNRTRATRYVQCLICNRINWAAQMYDFDSCRSTYVLRTRARAVLFEITLS